MARQYNFATCSCLWLILVCSAGLVSGQEESSCYGPGSIAASVILSIIFTAALVVALYYLWKKYRKRKELILETDPEKGKGEFAFDNPGFKDAGLTPVTKSLEKNSKLEGGKPKWNQWSPLAGLTTKSEKRKTLDDSAIDGKQVKVVALRSHDFTGLGFNICGNMKEGIYIKDVLHRGPASESGKLNSGDRINSVTISFEHMVYEDALTILSYASPYEVIIEARGGKVLHHPSGQGAQPSHPVYRSSSCADLQLPNVELSAKKRLFTDDHTGSISSNYSSLQKSRSNMTTLERKESKSPKFNEIKPRKPATKPLSPEQLKSQLEQKILTDHQQNLRNKNENSTKIEAETQKTENKFHKFGVRVLPSEQKSPKIAELSQNDNNINIEKQPPMGIDEVDEMKPQAKKREKKVEVSPQKPEFGEFTRSGSINGSGIKRDVNGIPQEIPSYLMNAAVAARSNRKSSEDRSAIKDDESDKTPKKLKGKAPSPPEEKLREPEKPAPKTNFDEIQSFSDDVEQGSKSNNKDNQGVDEEVELRSKENVKGYNSDSDLEVENQSPTNTIELNSSDITIHHAEENDDRQGRKTASTGDLSKIQKTRKLSGGTLERAQSLDITDTGIPTLTKKRKGGRIEDTFDMESDEDLFGKVMISKEPRLSLILDGLNTFQRNRLKKSTEWGNLEDAILKLNQEDDYSPSFEDHNVSLENVKFDFGGKSEEFDALVNKINEIKRESQEITTTIEEIPTPPVKPEKKSKNQIWPKLEPEIAETKANDVIAERNVQPVIEVERKERLSLAEKLEKFTNGRAEIELEEPPRLTSADRRQRKPDVFQNREQVLPPEQSVVVETTKPAVPEKKDYLLESRLISKQTYPPSVPDEDVEVVEKTIQWADESIANKSDETKTNAPYLPEDVVYLNLADLTKNFIFTEQIACSEDDDEYRYFTRAGDTNISDDIKVSRHSLGSLERAKSDDAKSVDLKLNVSNVTVNNVHSDLSGNLHSLEVSVDEPTARIDESKVNDVSELYTTALDNTIKPEYRKDMSKVTISTPDIIKNVTIAEAINTLNNDVVLHGPSSLTLEIPRDMVEVTENKFSTVTTGKVGEKIVNLKKDLEETPNFADSKIGEDESDDSLNKSNSSLTYITEIQVLTPNNTSNISEIEIIPNISTNGRNFDNDFENYVKNFESNVKNFESNIQTFENNLESPPKPDTKSIVLPDKIDAEKELHKIHEIAEEQLKKLPEMRFTTSSYESPKTPSEKRSSQIELLRSNFEKSPVKSSKTEVKSRIPIATTMKTPPTSPERRDSRNLDMENDREILELMSSTVHSTPLVSHSKYQIKPPSKNVTVTSIRSNSKIPSGLPVLGGSRPPIPPRKYESNDENVVQVSTNGGMESSFKQWVFNPADHSVTNIVVSESKLQK